MKKEWYVSVWVGGIVGWVYRPMTKKEILLAGLKKPQLPRKPLYTYFSRYVQHSLE